MADRETERQIDGITYEIVIESDQNIKITLQDRSLSSNSAKFCEDVISHFREFSLTSTTRRL